MGFLMESYRSRLGSGLKGEAYLPSYSTIRAGALPPAEFRKVFSPYGLEKEKDEDDVRSVYDRKRKSGLEYRECESIFDVTRKQRYSVPNLKGIIHKGIR